MKDQLLTAAGDPVALRRAATLLGPPARLAPPRSIAFSSVPKWQDFGLWPPLEWPRRGRGELQRWSRDATGHFCSSSVLVPVLAELVARHATQDWTCDIQDVEVFYGSKHPLEKRQSLDEMAEATSPSLIDDVSAAGLAANLVHREIRIIHGPPGADYFERYSWDGRLVLANYGGSHHFAAARYIAARLHQPVPLTGKLIAYELQPEAVRALTAEYHVLAVSARPEFYCAFFDAMEVFGATWLRCALPQTFEGAEAVFFPRSEKRSMRAAEILLAAGVADVGAHLMRLATKTDREACERGDDSSSTTEVEDEPQPQLAHWQSTFIRQRPLNQICPCFSIKFDDVGQSTRLLL